MRQDIIITTMLSSALSSQTENTKPFLERLKVVVNVKANGCSGVAGCGGCYGDDSRSDVALCQGLMMVSLP